MNPARLELRLIRGGKAMPWLGLPCDSCDRRLGAPRECGECAFLGTRQRVLEDRRKAKKQRRTTRQEAIH
jgi:hypothetical protein